MAELKITQRRAGPVVILDLDGKLNLGAGSTELHNNINGLLEEGELKILLNLERLSHMDSSGLGELVSAYARTQRYAGELKLINLVGHVYSLLVMTKLVTVFQTYTSEPDALASFDTAASASE